MNHEDLSRMHRDRDIDGLFEAAEALEDKLEQIKTWCRAYPLDVFPEPNWTKVQDALKRDGLSLDVVSASCMRHVTSGIQMIIDRGTVQGGQS